MDFKNIDEQLARGTLPSPADFIPAGFRDQMDLAGASQYGIVVASLDDAIAELESRGFGPFLALSGKPRYWRQYGEDLKISGRLALAYVGDIELELIETRGGTEFYSQSLSSPGKFHLHHVGLFEHSLAARTRQFNDAGCVTAIEGAIGLSPRTFQVEFAYYDCRDQVGMFVEIIDYRLGGIPLPPPIGINKALGRTQKALLRR